jgi:REP element-mobilizing transposase RayT
MTALAMGTPRPGRYRPPMSRRPRQYLPGAAFHITARVQNSEPLFEGLQEQLVALIRQVATRQRAQLLAYAVMPNHLHLVVIQGTPPLSHLMHSLLSGAAWLVKRHRRRRDHVFGRRYYSVPCTDAEYFRNAIAYVHLNPVRAGLCALPVQYEWTTHIRYTDACPGDTRSSALQLAADSAVRAFATCAGGLDRCRAAYGSFIAWRMAMDSYAAAADQHTLIAPPPPRPWTAPGDVYFSTQFQARARNQAAPRAGVTARADLHLLVRRTLEMIAPDMGLEHLRSGGRSRPLVAVRREVIARALVAGFAVCQVARYLCVSTSAVSVVSATLRQSSSHG